MRANTCKTYRKVIMRLHHPRLCTARSKHHARKTEVGLTLGRFDGLWRDINLFRSIHSRCDCVKKAAPVLALKLPMIMLRGWVSTKHRL